MSPTTFGSESANIVWTSAEIKKVELDEASARVVLALKYRCLHPKYDFGAAETNSTERWVFENGGWYRWPMGS